MQATLRLTARVQAGHKLEINTVELPEGVGVNPAPLVYFSGRCLCGRHTGFDIL